MRRAWNAVRWYLRELTGESQYDRYLARHAAGTQPLTRREFERARTDRGDVRPVSRCC